MDKFVVVQRERKRSSTRERDFCKRDKNLFATTASNTLELNDTLAIRKRLRCLLQVCVETVVSILSW